MKRQSIEGQIFSYDTWSDLGDGNLEFIDVTLTVPVGEFSVGSKFPAAFLGTGGSIIALRDSNETVHSFNLKVSVGDRIPDEELEAPVSCCSEGCGCGQPVKPTNQSN